MAATCPTCGRWTDPHVKILTRTLVWAAIVLVGALVVASLMLLTALVMNVVGVS